MMLTKQMQRMRGRDMIWRPVLTLTTCIALAVGAASLVPAQEPPAPQNATAAPAPNATSRPARHFTREELDQLVAPIALYPDPLISQILMAATYPVDVVMANRWIEDPVNATLQGDDLAKAVEGQEWDPSVKSLTPFPQILHMMDANLEWTENLGEAFLADQGAVMDAVQRLRRRAEASGHLQSNSEETVTEDEGEVVIEPPSPDYIYVPVCDPTVVYGAWPYPEYPPYYFSGFYAGLPIGDFGCGWWGEGIVAPLWGWDRWNWRQRHLVIDRKRFASLNGHRPPVGGGSEWQHNPYHRHNVPYSDPAMRDRYGTAPSETDRSVRGYPSEFSAPEYSHPAPTFESFGRGSDVRTEFERGHESRMSIPDRGGMSVPAGGGRPSGGASGGGGVRR